jgi:acid phosphatase
VFRLARRLRLAVFFITGRPEALRDGTLRDLRDSGYRGRSALVMKPNDYDRPSLVPYKSGARRRVERRGFTILANIGDQRSDLAAGFAERRYLIPNPMYVNP